MSERLCRGPITVVGVKRGPTVQSERKGLGTRTRAFIKMQVFLKNKIYKPI